MGFREAVQREKFITIQSYFKKQEKHQIDYLTLYLKQLQKEDTEILLDNTINDYPILVKLLNNSINLD